MKIERIDLYHVAMPLIEPWRTAYGEDAEVHSVLCRMASGSSVAWGESSPLAAPCYSPEFAAGVYTVCRDWFAPAVLGRDVQSGDELQQRLAHFKGNPFAKAVLDTAWWNLHSQDVGQPLNRLLGGDRDTVVVGADFGVTDSYDTLLTQIGGAIESGFPRIKLKFRPGWDVDMVRRVRDAFPEPTIHIDCNSGYRLSDAGLFQTLDEFQLAMIEQPLAHDDLLDHAELQRQIRTPVCLDESISGVRQARQAVALGSCRYINIKPGRVGGLTPALAIHDLAREAGIPCWVGGMLESATGASLCAALATLPNCTYPADIFPSQRFYREDLGERPIVLETDAQGRPCVPAGGPIPAPDPDRLARLTVQHLTLHI